MKGKKIYSLANADDVAVIAKKEEGMKEMINTLESYIKWKSLKVNVEKTKVMRCRKEGEKKKNGVEKERERNRGSE